MAENEKKSKRKRKTFTGVEKRGRGYLISYYDGNGNRKRETVYANSEKEAKDIRELRRLGVEQKDERLPRVELKTFMDNFVQELINDDRPQSSIRKYKERYDRLHEFIISRHPEVKLLSDVTPEHIKAYKAHRLQEGYSKNGINDELTIIRRLFNKAIEGGIMRNNPARAVEFYQEQELERDYLRENEIEKIFTTLSKNKGKPYYHYRFLYQFLYYVPWRKMEMADLKQDDFNNYDKTIRHRIKKTRDFRYVKLNETVSDILEKQMTHLYKMGIESDYMFPSVTGKRYHKNHILDYFKLAAKDAGIQKNVTVHMLRRSFVSNAHSKGYSLEQIAKMTGHKDIDTLREYYTVIPGDTQVEIQDDMYIGKKARKSENDRHK